MTNSNGSKPFEAGLGSGQWTRSSSVSSISGSLRQSIRRNFCGTLRSSSWLAGPASQEDPLRCSAVALVVSPEQRIQRSRLGPCCPPIQDHHLKNYRISFKTAEIRGVEAAQDKDRVLQRKQNPRLPEHSRRNARTDSRTHHV